MILSDLRISILNLPLEEQLAIHQRIRDSRLVAKKRVISKAMEKRKAEKSVTIKGLNSMGEDELSKLISMLEEI